MDVIWILIGVAALLVVVLVVRAAVRSMNPKVPTPVAPTTAIPVIRSASQALPPATAAQIDALVAAEQKIAAIKVLRDATGVSLQEAKDRIDRWIPHTTSHTLPHTTPHTGAGFPPHASVPTPGGASIRSTLPAAVVAEIDRLVAADQKISAIKLLREHTGLGLKDSKDAVESWPTGHHL